MHRTLFPATAAALLLSALGYCCFGHDGPEHEIEELTEQMKVQGESAELLLKRAIELKLIGKLAEAANDLERALDLDEQSVPAQRELSLTYFSLGKTNEALSTVTAALKAPTEGADQASLLMVRAGILRARREYAKALADANEAIRQYPDNVEWFLIRSQLQAVLKLKSERVKGLEAGLSETGSGLLLAEWVDALIDNGQYAPALAEIETEVRASRWKSAWLIRRAKVRLATGKTSEAQADLHAAIEELNRRLSTSAPDALLLADRALAYELMGQREEARRDYRTARQKGLSDEWVRERIRTLRDSGRDDD